MPYLKKLYNDSLIKNAIYLTTTNLLNLGLGFLFWVIAARYYTTHEVGTISSILSVMFLISTIGALGFTTSLLYYLPRENVNISRIVNSCVTACILASFIFSFIFIYWVDIWSPTLTSTFDSLESKALFFIVTIAYIVSLILSSALIAGKRSSYYMIKNSFFGLVKIFPLPFLIGFGALGIFFTWGLGVILSIILSFIFILKIWKNYFPALCLDQIIKGMARYSAGNYLAEIFYYLPRYILPILIANTISPESTAFFYISITVATLLYGVSQAFSKSLLAESSDGELWSKVRKCIRFTTAFHIPGILFFLIFGKFVLNLFNTSYAENAYSTLIILIFTSLPMSVITLFTSVRNIQKKISSVVKVNFAVAIITLTLAVPLTRIMNIEGAAIAYLAANLIVSILIIYKMKDPGRFISKQIYNPQSNISGSK